MSQKIETNRNVLQLKDSWSHFLDESETPLDTNIVRPQEIFQFSKQKPPFTNREIAKQLAFYNNKFFRLLAMVNQTFLKPSGIRY